MAVVDSAPPVAKKRAHASKTETVTGTKRRKILREANIAAGGAHSSKTETVIDTKRREILRLANIEAARALSSKTETVTDTERREIVRGEIVRQVNIAMARDVVDIIRTAHAQRQEILEYMHKAKK